MLIAFILCILLPTVLGNNPAGNTLTTKPKVDTYVSAVNLKDIPSTEIKEHILHNGDDKNKRLLSERKVNLPEVVQIKSIKPKLTGDKNNKSKLKKWRKKLKRKQLKNLIKKNNRKQKQLKKLNRMNMKNVQKRNKLKYKGKKQTKSTSSTRLSTVIDRIMSYHEEGKDSKLTTQEIRKQILNLLTANKRVLNLVKDCQKTRTAKKMNNVLKKRPRSLNRNKVPRKRPIKVVVLKGAAIGKRLKNINSKKEGRTKMYETKGKKGGVKSKMMKRLEKKKKNIKNQKKSLGKKKQKPEKNV